MPRAAGARARDRVDTCSLPSGATARIGTTPGGVIRSAALLAKGALVVSDVWRVPKGGGPLFAALSERGIRPARPALRQVRTLARDAPPCAIGSRTMASGVLAGSPGPPRGSSPGRAGSRPGTAPRHPSPTGRVRPISVGTANTGTRGARPGRSAVTGAGRGETIDDVVPVAPSGGGVGQADRRADRRRRRPHGAGRPAGGRARYRPHGTGKAMLQACGTRHALPPSHDGSRRPRTPVTGEAGQGPAPGASGVGRARSARRTASPRSADRAASLSAPRCASARARQPGQRWHPASRSAASSVSPLTP